MLQSLTFPKMMRWGTNSFRFSRPVKNILCLWDGKMLPFSLGGIHASNRTAGHRILSPGNFHVKSAGDYIRDLKAHKVIIDPQKRRKKIIDQMEKKLIRLEAQIFPDEELMQKMTYDVECPHVFLGEFPQDYLSLPLEVLSTAMKKGANVFSVVKGKRQLPYFVGVADNSSDSKGYIRKGNERVLKARLEDAKFFWEQDLNVPLKQRAQGLADVTFQENLGSYVDKVQRLKKLTAYIAGKLDAKQEKKNCLEAAELCKVDLITEMVREFPSLQGIVGGLYARKEKYTEAVWKAVYQHYLPGSAEDRLPSSLNGTMLSLADKLDSVIGVVGIGVKVSASKDPFALRRNVLGICRIIHEKKLNLSLSRLMDKAIAGYEENVIGAKDKIKEYCTELFRGRIQYLMESMGYRYDLIQAAMGPGVDNIYYTFLKVRALESLKASPQFEPMIWIARRVGNILREQSSFRINASLLQEKEERDLYTTFTILKENVRPLIASGDFTKAQRIFFRIRSSINSFFDHVLVMVEDRRLRNNRLALLQEIQKLLWQMADYSKVVLEGDKEKG
jgi:glycyl-tRNA synthetase beta chain